MLRAHRIAPAGHWPAEQCRGTVTLGYDERHRRRLRLATDAGEAILLDLAQTTVLADGDGLALSEGGFVAVRAAPEDLVEITAGTPALLARIAWHIGNRHVPAELDGRRILIRDDHVIVAMVEGLGGMVRRIQAPFTPEGGAYAAHAHAPESDDGHI
jgi:urease accessory protein